ncbi:MAG: Omp28-related outer membrane protein [Nonlabens sp.]|uniref:Omp28-related outer membrane protein n=1 Tax=Nonlabens sp. TaxID=1888209 RepID=UPI003EF0D0A3
MKNIFQHLVLIIIINIGFYSIAQAPQGFNYQSTIRDNSGSLINNQTVIFQFDIYSVSPNTTPVYSENHTVTTDNIGQISLVIGQGTPLLGTFLNIDWANTNHHLGIQIDTGSGLVSLGSSQFLSVPYALYAENSSIPSLTDVLSSGNDASAIRITNLQDPVDNQDAATKAYVDSNNSQNQIPSGINPGDMLIWDGNAWVATPSPFSATNITVNSDSTSYLLNSVITLTSIDNFSNDLTTDTIFSIDGAPISGNTFIGLTPGTKIITGEYNGRVSSPLIIEVIANSYTKKILIDSYTGAWSGQAPRVSNTFSIIDGQSNANQFIRLDIHNGDSMAYLEESILRSTFNVNLFPSAYIDRSNLWNAVDINNMDLVQINDFLSNNDAPGSGLSINSTISGNMVNTTVQVGFDIDFSDTKLVVYLVEDNVIFNQSNSTTNYGGVNPLVNFQHNNVMLARFTNLLGDSIPNNQSLRNNIFSSTYTTSIPSTPIGVVNGNLKIIAFLTNNNNEVINAQIAGVGTNQPFD